MFYVPFSCLIGVHPIFSRFGPLGSCVRKLKGGGGEEKTKKRTEEHKPREDGPFGPHPQYGWDFPEEIPEKFRKDPGNALRAFPGIPLKSTAGIPQALQFKAFEGSRAFQKSLPPVPLGTPLFSEVVPERYSQSW